MPRFHLVTRGKVLIVVVSAQAADRTGAWVEQTEHNLTAVLRDSREKTKEVQGSYAATFPVNTTIRFGYDTGRY
jgi:hypothetical protein